MKTQWTLVRHTGYSIGDNPQFEKAVEMRNVELASERRVIASAGGLLIDSYDEASLREEHENYPKEVKGVIPRAKGSFVSRKGFDEEIYVPARRT